MKNGNWLFNCALSVIVSVMSFVGGCVRSHAGAPYRDVYGDRLILSSDNKDAAYVWTDMSIFMLTPLHFLAHQQEYVGWSSDGGRKNHLVSVVRWNNHWEYVDDSFRLILDLQYSPDSTHLAALTPAYIEVIDVKTEKRLQLKLPSVGSIRKMRWVSPDKIAYMARLGDEEIYKVHRGPMKKALFIQDVVADSQPKELFASPEVKNAFWRPPYFFFSPDAQHVAIVGQEDVTLLNLDTGQKQTLNPGPHTRPPLVAWSPDGSALLLVTPGKERRQVARAVLINSTNGKITDLAEQMTVFKDLRVFHVAFSGNNQIVFGDRNDVQVFNLDESGVTSSKVWRSQDHGSGYVSLLSGWVVAGPTGLSNERHSTAVRYADGKRVELSKKHCLLSDDGRHLAEVVGKGKVTVREFQLSADAVPD